MAAGEQASKKKFLKPPAPESRKLDSFIKPMLAKETRQPFDDDEWLFEIKWDGYRAIAEIENGQVKLYSRNGLSFLNRYPVVAAALGKIAENCVLDGEVVVLNDEGQPSFQFLQHYENNTHRPIQFYVFDILSHNGKDTCALPLTERKELVKKLIKTGEVIKYSDHIIGQGKSFFGVTAEKNLEGIIAKKCDSRYYTGIRTGEWLKIKHNKTREAVIGGYTKAGGSRKYFGALVLGVWEDDHLKYIGHTGSGFNQQSLAEMYALLQPLVQEESPFRERVKTNMPVTWVKPELVCEVKFSEITNDGKMRLPIFLRLRDDQSTKEVNAADMTTVKKAKGSNAEDQKDAKSKIFSFGKIKVTVSNPNKIYFPEEGITKEDVANYYIEISKYILPYLKGRPQSLLRNPNGIHAKGFFHKDAGDEAPAYVKSRKIFSESTNKDIDYILCDNQPTLTYLNNLGCIEINPWHSTVSSLDYPDYLIIDIDPSAENNFEQVIEAANAVKHVLDKAGAASYCKTSGASGLHVYVPVAKKYTYDQVKDFAYLVCMLAHEQIPDFTTLERNLKKRGDRHIYMDYLQNRRGQTIASVYSLRPRPGATVSMPLLWKEVKTGLTPVDFNIKNCLSRIKKMGDIFSGVVGKGIDINACLKKMGA